MRLRAITGCFLCLFSLEAVAQNRSTDLPRERLRDDVVKYFAGMRAFTTFINRGQRAADTFELPPFEVNPRRELCFPTYGGGPIRGQPIENLKYETKVDLAGLVKAASAAVSAEIGANVTLATSTAVQLQKLAMEDPDFRVFMRDLKTANCPELDPKLRDTKTLKKHILIRNVYYGLGAFNTSMKLTVSGKLSFEAADTLTNWLSRVGIKVPNLSTSGTYEDVGSNHLPITEDLPIAFRPFYLNEDDFKEKYSRYIADGLDRRLAEALSDDTKTIAFLSERPELVMPPGAIWTKFAEGNLIDYEPENERHGRYLTFTAHLLVANRIRTASAQGRPG